MRMDCLQTMRERRSIRQYKHEPVSEEQLRLVLEAAQRCAILEKSAALDLCDTT